MLEASTDAEESFTGVNMFTPSKMEPDMELFKSVPHSTPDEERRPVNTDSQDRRDSTGLAPPVQATARHSAENQNKAAGCLTGAASQQDQNSESLSLALSPQRITRNFLEKTFEQQPQLPRTSGQPEQLPQILFWRFNVGQGSPGRWALRVA